ncbi:MAG: exo-alpha-sialidase [Planctomycetaceae bacterium]|nr:exo-alpha-sialidase [Planctomycetaceae bacterium]
MPVIILLLTSALLAQSPAPDIVGVSNRKLLSDDQLHCERIALGAPDDYKPCIAKLPSGELLLTAFHQHDQGGGKVLEQSLLFRSVDGGRSWSDPQELDLLGREPYLSVMQDGTVFITGHLLANDVRNEWGYTTGFIHRSTDGGRMWESTRIVSEGIKPGASNHSSRNVLELSDGTLLVGVDYDGGGGPYFVWRSTDRGQTWDKSQTCTPRNFASQYGFFGGETWLWQARNGKVWALVRVDSNELPIKDRPIAATDDQADHFILFSSTDKGATFDRVRDFGDYGEMYMSLLRLQDLRLLLTFTVRDLHPPLGVRALLGSETTDGFAFDFEHDRLMLDTKTPVGEDQGGGFGPSVQLNDGTLVTSLSWRDAESKTHLEVVRWNAPDTPPPAPLIQSAPGYEVELTRAAQGYDGQMCWVHARAGAIPAGAPGVGGDAPAVVMTTQKLDVTGSDVFFALHDFRTDDFGAHWDGPRAHGDLGRRPFPEGGEIVVADFWPRWHAASGKLLGTGHTIRYTDNAVVWDKNPRWTAYAVYDPRARQWAPWKTLEVPQGMILTSSGAGCSQRVDLPNGDILLPVYCNPLDQGHVVPSSVVVLRCRFDGETLKYVEHGNVLHNSAARGFAEPSLAAYGGQFYLTIRHDDFAAVCRSSDGLYFDNPVPWEFDDGAPLGSYNTQAHWVVHSDALFLVYTRKGAANEHVFRHRAPLFIAQVDPERLVVIRATERILVPERGARLGNFGITDVSPDETWVTVTEWMQTWGPNVIIPADNKYGADNSIYVAKIRWKRPNTLLRQN